MPRQARLDAPGTLHHVMGRGIEGTKIFRNRIDRNDFIERVAELCREGYFTAYALALMSNHFHLLIKAGNRPLAAGMRKLLPTTILAGTELVVGQLKISSTTKVNR